MTTEKRHEPNSDGQGSGKNWLEWSVFAIGLALVATVVGYLLYDAIAVKPSPPSLEVVLGEPTSCPEGFSLSVVVRNRGTEAAEGVVIQIVKRSPTSDPETVDLTLDYVPGEASRRGSVVFGGSPAADLDFDVASLSYQHP